MNKCTMKYNHLNIYNSRKNIYEVLKLSNTEKTNNGVLKLL